MDDMIKLFEELTPNQHLKSTQDEHVVLKSLLFHELAMYVAPRDAYEMTAEVCFKQQQDIEGMYILNAPKFLTSYQKHWEKALILSEIAILGDIVKLERNRYDQAIIYSTLCRNLRKYTTPRRAFNMAREVQENYTDYPLEFTTIEGAPYTSPLYKEVWIIVKAADMAYIHDENVVNLYEDAIDLPQYSDYHATKGIIFRFRE